MQSREAMSLGQLMNYYLEGSQVANGGTALAAPGAETTVFAETHGGQGYSPSRKAIAWGELKSEPTVLLQIPENNSFYALSYKTYREICDLRRRDLSKVQFQNVSSDGAQPGAKFSVITLEKRTVQATAWYMIPPGRIRLFEVDGKHYAISLQASKTSRQDASERRTTPPDDRREIIWHDFDSTIVNSPNFPMKPSYLL